MTLVQLAQKLRPLIEKAAQSLSDEDALDAVQLYPHWIATGHYVSGEKYQYNSVVYVVLQDHDGQSQWTPDISPSLFARVLSPDPTVIPEWVQPDSTNPYMIGDKVTHSGKTWESIIDNNVWEPGVYGWNEVT